MRKLRVIYKPYRVGLFAIALGLAFVPIIENFRKADSDVQLPVAQSSDVLPVFVSNSRFARLGVGGGHWWRPVRLYEVKTDTTTGRLFQLINGLADPIYLPKLQSNSESSQTALPYFLECQSGASGLAHGIPSQFDLDDNPVKLNPEDELRFWISSVPSTARRCVVIVRFASSEQSARALARQNPFSAVTEDSFFEGDRDWNSAAAIVDPQR